MNWTDGLSWLSAFKPGHAERGADEPDRADMGTAFGLDASFGPVDDQPPMVPGAGPVPSSLPWEHRLTRRSSL